MLVHVKLARIAPFLLSLSSSLALAPAAAAESTDLATLAHAGPGATIRAHRLLPWRAMKPGQKLRIGAELHCANGCTIRFVDGSTIALDAHSTVSILDPTFVRAGSEGDAAIRAEGVSLRGGAITVDVAEHAKRPILVGLGGDDLALVDKGRSRFVAHADRTGIASHGTARVRGGGRWVTLAPSHAASVRPGVPAPDPRPLVGAPTWTVSDEIGDPRAPLALALASPFASVGGRWLPLEGAAGYRVQIARDPRFASVVQDLDVPGHETGFLARPLPPGQYFARVKAVDHDGLDGGFSPARPLRVIGAELPPGALSADAGRTLVVPEGGSVRFLDAAGLEAAVDRGGFVRLDPMLRTSKEERGYVRLRLAGDPLSTSVFTLERRALHAEIEMSPKLARWPDDPIDIRVAIVDPSARIDPATIKPTFKVLVGLDEAPVEWTQSGSYWTARVPPRPTNGPSVVRIIATDQDGATLGRAFLEVEGPSARISAASPATRSAARN